MGEREAEEKEKVDVWIDTDPAIGIPDCDVDDGLALIQAFHSPELRIRGVSAVFGNAPLRQAYPLAQEVCDLFGPKGLPVFRGAASKDELARENAAVRGLAGALELAPLTVLALGPLTNVGSLLALRPDLAPRIESIVMVAARRPGLEFFSTKTQKDPFPDFNFECDPGAMQCVLDSEVDIVFAPWEVSSHAWLTAEDLDMLAAASDAGAYIAERSRQWLSVWTDTLGAPGFNPFDTLAVGWLTHPEMMECFEGPVWIEDATPVGDAPAKPLLHVDPNPGNADRSRRALYCQRPSPAFKPMLLSRLRAPAA